jgi:two-component system response regulator DesR
MIAVQSARVREALVAMLSALDGFRVVAEAANCEEALAAARVQRPQLALVDQELSGIEGPWTIHCMQLEGLVDVIVALGRGADGVQARLAGARAYVQIGTPPRDLLTALRGALAS